MKQKKYYAVHQGFYPGVFTDVSAYRRSIDGYPNAVSAKFSNRQAANAFVRYGPAKALQDLQFDEKTNKTALQKNSVIAFVDGSFNKNEHRYSYGVVLLSHNEVIHIAGNGDDPRFVSLNSTAGELVSAICAMQYAQKHHIPKLVICHDNACVASLCCGDSKPRAQGTKEYKRLFDAIIPDVDIVFKKIKSHSGVFYNDVADALARQAASIPLKKNAIQSYLQQQHVQIINSDMFL